MLDIISNFRGWLQRRQDLRYLSQLDGPGLSDLGICRSDALEFANAPGDVKQRMEQMAEAHGLSPEVIWEQHWRHLDMARACSHCGSRAECKSWLRHDTEGRGKSEFCPNETHFMDLVKNSRGSA